MDPGRPWLVGTGIAELVAGSLRLALLLSCPPAYYFTFGRLPVPGPTP
jgi:hypothetical protein